jgi:serine/threonine protein kinase/Tol biopolymer transport system component
MALTRGTTFGPFEILDALGSGGFGEVYKARDVRLGRIVAIKILPAADAELRARFEREARAIAALQHPHICTLFDIGRERDADYLVLEYLEGETLAARLARQTEKPIAIAEALRIAAEIADALDRAHRAGIVHRDLKPGNVMLTSDGVKLLDFGLAKFRGGAAPSVGGVSIAATMATPVAQAGPPLTGQGTILGTLHYMSPEQLECRDPDARCDLWALGCILYEIVVGRKPFDGASGATLIGAIVRDEPPLISSACGSVPRGLERLVARCLEKDPNRRWQTAADLRSELLWIASESAARAPADAALMPRRARRMPVSIRAIGIAIVALGIGVAAGISLRRPQEPPAVLRFNVFPESGTTFTPAPVSRTVQAALSPDGRYLTFVASNGAAPTLWIRALDAVAAAAMPGTEGAAFPFWAPDSRAIGFFARGKLLRIDVNGSGLQTLAVAPSARGGSWNAEGTILYAPSSGAGLMRVAAGGGAAQPATSLAAGNRQRFSAEYWPTFLPDGRHFLSFALAGSKDDRGVYIGSLGSLETKQLARTDTMAAYASGHLLFVRDGTLVAQPFDLGRLELTGTATPIAEHVGYYPNYGHAGFSVSPSGLLIYAPSATTAGQLTWIDRSGTRGSTVGPPATYTTPQLSPDDSRVIAAVIDPLTATNDLWLFELNRGTASRLTFDPASDFFPVWSPDGRTLAFSSDRSGIPDLYRKPSSGIGQEERVLSNPRMRFPTDWSHDGRTLVFQESSERGYDLMLLPTSSSAQPVPFLQSPFNEGQGRLSPDGRWMAYISDESARVELYVQPVPPTGSKWQVSTGGGSQPAWRRDGLELFYISNGKMTAVSVNPAAREFDHGVPHALFDIVTPDVSAPFYWYYTVTSDGQRFLANVLNADSYAIPITVVVNWTALLKK